MKLHGSGFIGALLLTKAKAASEDPASSSSHGRQYCVGKTGGSLFNDDPVPTVTIIYSGTTTVTTLAAFTNCEGGHKLSADSPSSGIPIASTTDSRNAADGSTSAGRGESVRSSQPAGTVPNASALSSQQLSAPNAASASASYVIRSTTPTGGNTFAPSSPPAASGSGANTQSGLAGVSDDLQATKSSPHLPTPTSGDNFAGVSSVPKSAATDEKASGSGGTQPNSNTWATATFSSASLLPVVRSTQTAATLNLPSPAGPRASGGTTGSWNSTLALSPAAIDALQFAQFLKNLGASVFNPSRQVTTSMTGDRANSTSLNELIASMSLQEQKQQETLLGMLRRSGSVIVPPCEYNLPSNVSGISSLMSVLKTVEVGVFMSLAESLSSDDTSTAIVLSSIASVAARQNAILRAQANLNVSAASFETPLSVPLAYNLLLNFVRSGSCLVELPIPILPTLSINGGVSAYAQANSNVTFAWDAAGKAAASRSGKSLHIGWINQVDSPVYTSVLALGDGRGMAQVPPGLVGTAIAVLTAQPGLASVEDLTDATLAGPVVVNLSR